jgi:quinol monooxygenase YgiN
MAIVMISDAGSDSIEQYDQVIKQLADAGHGNPPGRLSHVAAQKDNGSYFVVDVWESEDALRRFSETLLPLIGQAGGNPPELKVSPLHNAIDGK